MHNLTPTEQIEEALYVAHLLTQPGVDDDTALHEIGRRYGYDRASTRRALDCGRQLLDRIREQPELLGPRAAS